MNHQTAVFIDTQNVHLGIQSCGWVLDREKFIILLKDKFNADKVCMFLGYLPEYEWFYERLLADDHLGYPPYADPTSANYRNGKTIKTVHSS